jgi:DNA polymerase-3 subunit epsilon
VKLARRFLPVVRRRSLDSLSHHYGIENTARHRAGGDAVATAQVLLRLLDNVRLHGLTTLDDVTARLNAIPKRGRRKKRRARPYSASDDASA